jgi:hypothetical protein
MACYNIFLSGTIWRIDPDPSVEEFFFWALWNETNFVMGINDWIFVDNPIGNQITKIQNKISEIWNILLFVDV